MRVIFDAGPQRWKIWFVGLISLATGATLVMLGSWVIQSYGLHPDDGGVLKPLSTRILFSLLWVVPGLAIIAAMVAYLQCYVTRIEVDEGREYHVTVAGFGRGLRFGHHAVAGAGFNDGVSHAGGMSVNAPWYSVRLRGRRLPLIVDLQGDFLDEHAVDRLIGDEPAPARRA